jgi:hypothetical protein
MSGAIAAAPGNLPSLTLVAISQAEAALTKTCAPSIALRACAGRRASPANHQISASVSSSSCNG